LVAEVTSWHAAYQLYLQQRWDEAELALQQLCRRQPGSILYGVYLERIASLRAQTLAMDWDGSYRHSSK
jgi:hypothetical protein